MKIAICVGHSRPNDGGAVSVAGVSEWAYNNGLADRIRDKLAHNNADLAVEIFRAYQGDSYPAAMAWLRDKLKCSGAQAAIELHFNSSDDIKARGHEWLYCNGSIRGFALAKKMHDMLNGILPGIPSRGVKPLNNSARGGLFVTKTHCPAVICEPFFGSNALDWRIAFDNMDFIAASIAGGITAYLAD